MKVSNTEISLPIIKSTGLYPYQKYIRLQEYLRRKRKELILICEHSAVITGGIQKKDENLLTGEAELHSKSIPVLDVNRAGDYTAHEPGQLVIYPHINLDQRKIKMNDFFQAILDITANRLQIHWDLKVHNDSQSPGLYLDKNNKKILSIGILFKSFFTTFGIALNVQNSLTTFQHINPCGADFSTITTIVREKLDPELATDFEIGWCEDFQKWLGSNSFNHDTGIH